MKSLFANEIGCESAKTKIDALSMGEFPDLYANLHHYYDDEDIRAKDPEYRAFQNKELEKLIKHLEAGNTEKANEISFLHES